MNSNAKKWVDALRSGDYKQTEGQLRSGEAFCCLGVACEIAVQEGVIEEYDPGSSGLPNEVQTWLGLRSFEGDYNAGVLTEDNDRNGHSFERIAQTIESEPEGLFA